MKPGPDSPPVLMGVDHVHVHVRSLTAAVGWYRRVLGLVPIPKFASWARDGGPTLVGDPSGSVHLSLFERPVAPSRSVVAFRVDGPAFLAWRTHLAAAGVDPVGLDDHALAWSLYFADPDGNPFEVTTYDHAFVADRIAR